ncbi:putative motility protein [Brevibacillus centrosporus]|uniref:Putative motility protein n=1 Tax=Brevibacillus centrosporus TaxID=54910 RepID=A0A1I4CJ86_9BACL|nr:putative motility protein [Brevibacillus centrosporus]SFK80011.1 Putative motility protein [Brevibacillus centrosporus]
MDINSLMSAQLGQLQQTVGISIMKMSQASQTAGAAVMLDDFTKAQATAQASHPSLGKHLDVSV